MSSPSSYASSMTYGAKSPTAVANRATQELEAARAKDVATTNETLQPSKTTSWLPPASRR